MCNCKEEKKKTIIETASSKIDSLRRWKIKEAEFKNEHEVFFSTLNIPVIVKGLNGNGNYAKKELYYAAIYCPFCGEKYE